ncbi:MAG: ferritin-like domain-containing protein [Pseudomonadota bacterium]|nr:ferritin-like domain-containing protein [Pseudomonadota bacterium]
MKHWTLDDIAWEQFDRSKLRPELLSLVKAACMVEHNGEDYARYLCEVFHDDPEFQQAARDWAQEEVQHGQALRKWAEIADPDFRFDQSFSDFTTGYKLPAGISTSVRGSRPGELVARCVVESGTSTYYTAISEYTDEPVLKQICAHIAADEFRHYKLFYDHLRRYLKQEKMSIWARLRVALGRVTESEDDELAYAFYAAHTSGDTYDRKRYAKRYLSAVSRIYRRPHIERLAAMVLKAAGLKPNGRLGRASGWLAWQVMRLRAA